MKADEITAFLTTLSKRLDTLERVITLLTKAQVSSSVAPEANTEVAPKTNVPDASKSQNTSTTASMLDVTLETKRAKAKPALTKDSGRKQKKTKETVTCPFGTEHDADERICDCGFGHKDYIISIDGETRAWTGGFWDLYHEVALQPDANLHPETSEVTGQWALTQEEVLLVSQWREFREAVLDSFGDDKPYRYEIEVKLGEISYELLSRSQGLVTAQSPFKKGKAN